jgi:hypothetical protein
MIKYVYVVALSVTAFAISRSEEPLRAPAQESEAINAHVTPVVRPSLDEARREAEVLHVMVHATLQHVHHRYYREDEGLPIPAAIMKDVFADLEKEQHVKLRWLAVEGQAMNADHKPQGAFENEAVKALKEGKQYFDHSENGIYRRAGAITLTNHCLKCHVPDRKSTENRTAGLIIAILVSEK